MKQKNFIRFINPSTKLTQKQRRAAQRILEYGDKKMNYKLKRIDKKIIERNLVERGSRIIGRYWGWHCRPNVSINRFETFVKEKCKLSFKCFGVSFYNVKCLTPSKWNSVLNCDLVYKDNVYVAIKDCRETMYDYLKERF
jgi:hypothetical protein